MKQQDTKMDSTELIGHRRLKRRGLTVFNLKVIGAIFMFLSVASVTVVPAVFGDITKDMTALSVAMICEIVSWCAIPIYAWLLFDGYRHTHNRWLYLLQLLVLALACEVPYDKVTSGKYVDMNSQNPVFGLLIALIVMAAFDWVKRRYEGGRAVCADGHACHCRTAVESDAAYRLAAGCYECRCDYLGVCSGVLPDEQA